MTQAQPIIAACLLGPSGGAQTCDTSLLVRAISFGTEDKGHRCFCVMEFEGQEAGTSGAFLYHVVSTVCRGESNQTGPAEMEETGTMSMRPQFQF